MDRRQILLVILSKFRGINLYSVFFYSDFSDEIAILKLGFFYSSNLDSSLVFSIVYKVSVFGVILVRNFFPAFSRIISPYSVRMRENAGKMRTRITPNTDTFYAVQIVGLIGDDYLRAHLLCIVDDLWLWTMTMIYFAFNLIIC